MREERNSENGARRGVNNRDCRLAAVIIALHVVLGVIYSVTVPAWEAHDEWAHYKYVEYVARHWALPPPGTPLTTELCCDQANQPPLYYFLAALPVALIDTSDRFIPQVNPYMETGRGVGGINAMVHHSEAERFPWRGTILGLHVARFMSVGLSLIGLLAVYQLLRMVAPTRRDVALTALVLAAFWPQYLFIGSVVTNDILASVLGCVVAWLAVRVAAEGLSARAVFGLLFAIGLALTTKASALALVPVVLIALFAASRRPSRGLPMSKTSRIAVVTGLLAGSAGGVAWLWNNVRLTGFILPRYPWFPYWFLERLAGRGQVEFGHGFPGFLETVRYAFITVWASFGWGNLEAYRWVYVLFGCICVAAILGLMMGLVRARREQKRLLWPTLLVLLIVLLVALVGVREFLYGTYQLRGRMLLPGLAAMVSLLALGCGVLTTRLPERWRMCLPCALGSVLVIANLLIALRLIPAAYAPPPLMPDARLHPGEQPLGIRFGQFAELVAYTAEPARISPGQDCQVTLLWRAIGQFDRNYTLSVQVLDAGFRRVGGLNMYPGRGNFATTLWKTGDVFREVYRVPVHETIAEPSLARIRVSLFLPVEGFLHLAASDAQGVLIGDAAIFGRLKIAPVDARPKPATEAAILARMEDHIVLIRADMEPVGPVSAGNVLFLTLHWQAIGTPPADYFVFVHLIGPDGIVAQGDGYPAGGAYPTGLWEFGETIVDPHRVQLPADLPPGEYQWRVGLYVPGGERVPAFDKAGKRWPNDQVPLDGLSVYVSPSQ